MDDSILLQILLLFLFVVLCWMRQGICSGFELGDSE